jgi:hypothetical protein
MKKLVYPELNWQSQDVRSCCQVVLKLWPLSPWVIHWETLDKACQDERLPLACKNFLQQIKGTGLVSHGKGCCHGLFAVDCLALQKYPYLKPAFALPLMWKAGVAHAEGLPDSLKRLAEEIRLAVSPDQFWGLQDNLGVPCDLRELWHFQKQDSNAFDSLWATLAASLLLTIQGGMLNPTLFATAAWDASQGICKVNGLEGKIATVYDLGGKTLFVPKSNEQEASDINKKTAQDRNCQPSDILKIEVLECGNTHIKQVLRPILAAHQNYPPDQSEPLDLRCNYYQCQVELGVKEANQYYQTYLQEELAEECRKRGIQDLDENSLANLDSLVSFVSFNPEGALFVISTLRPRHTLLFYTKETEKHIPQVEEKIKKYNGVAEKILFEDKNSVAEDQRLTEKICSFVEQHGATKTVVDVTPGPKDFSAFTIMAVNANLTPLLYLCHYWNNATRSFAAGKERIRRLLPMAEK